jgi:hypothetical protein
VLYDTPAAPELPPGIELHRATDWLLDTRNDAA